MADESPKENKTTLPRFSRRVITIASVFLIVIAGLAGYLIGSNYAYSGAIGNGSTLRAANYESQIANLTAQVNNLTNKATILKNKVQDLQALNSTNATTIKSLQDQASKLESESASLRVQIATLQSSLDATNGDNGRLSAQVSSLQDKVTSLQVAASSLQSKLDCIGSTPDPVCAKALHATFVIWSCCGNGSDKTVIAAHSFLTETAPGGFDYHDNWNSSGIIRVIYMTIEQYEQYAGCNTVPINRLSCVFKPDDTTIVGPDDRASDTFTQSEGCGWVVVYENNNDNAVTISPNIAITYTGYVGSGNFLGSYTTSAFPQCLGPR